jgi:hypothetical protein
MRYIGITSFALTLLALQVFPAKMALGETSSGPFVGNKFQGRIAYSADGNNRDRDDLFASAVTIAMFKAFGVTDKVVHFDYNSILGEDNPEYLKVHEASVRGAAQRFGLSEKVIFNDSRELDAAIRSIRDAVNASSATDPLLLHFPHRVERPVLLGYRQSTNHSLPPRSDRPGDQLGTDLESAGAGDLPGAQERPVSTGKMGPVGLDAGLAQC